MFAILDGCVVESFNFSNRAFEYGDGIFETIIAYRQTIQFWQNHYRRLVAGCKALHFEIPENFSDTFLEKSILLLAEKNDLKDFFRIKINVWRQTGGWYAPTRHQVHYSIRVFPYQPKTEKVKHKAIFFADVPLVHSVISPFKTLNSLPYVLAGIAAQKQKAQEAILLSNEGYIAEAIASNVFWVKNDEIFTPSLRCGGKKGIMQEKIFEKIKTLGIPLHIGEFSPKEVLEADVVFTSNVAGIETIQSIENKNFKTTHRFLDIFQKILIA